MDWIETEGGPLRVESTGDGPGVPLLLVHGGGGDRSHWDRLVPLLSGRQVVSYDQRGYGESSPREGSGESLAALARDVVSVADGLGLERPVLVGHSFGGAVVASALSRPVRTGSAARCSSMPPGTSADFPGRRWRPGARTWSAGEVPRLEPRLVRAGPGRRPAGYPGARPGHPGAHPAQLLRRGDGDAARLRSRRGRPPVRRPAAAGHGARHGWPDEPPRRAPRAAQPIRGRVEPLAAARPAGGGGGAALRVPGRSRRRALGARDAYCFIL